MKLIATSMLLLLLSCGNSNGRLFDPSVSTPNLKPVKETNSQSDLGSSFLPDGLDSDWKTDLDFTDLDGNPLTDGKVKFVLRNCDLNQKFFDGEFNLGHYLDLDQPLTSSGILDFNLDVQPFFGPNSLIAHGESYLFDKKSWARHVSDKYSNLDIFYQIHTHSSGQAIRLCTDIQVDAGDGYSDISTTVYEVANHYSNDNDALVDEVSRNITDVLGLGGPVYIDPRFELDEFDPPFSDCSFDRLKVSDRNSLIHAFEIKDSSGWNSLKENGSEFWDTIGTAIGATTHAEFVSRSAPQPDVEWGNSCDNYIERFNLYSAVLKLDIDSIRVSDGVDNTKYVEVKLGIAESF